jgi:hypothetical protein
MVHNSLCKHHFSLICPIITNQHYIFNEGGFKIIYECGEPNIWPVTKGNEGTSTILSLRNCYQKNWHSLPSGPYLNSPRPSVFDIEGDLSNQNSASSCKKTNHHNSKIKVPISQGRHFWCKRRPMQPKLSILLWLIC